MSKTNYKTNYKGNDKTFCERKDCKARCTRKIRPRYQNRAIYISEFKECKDFIK